MAEHIELQIGFNHGDTFEISEAAAKRIKYLVELEGRDGFALRINVSAGGCSGFMYEFAWSKPGEKGRVFERDGAKVIIDESDLRLISGSSLKFHDNLMGSYFEIDNPNAGEVCSCGKSFS